MDKQFKDYFSKQAEIYAKARPSYPDELFNHLSEQCSEHDTAWDCATGNGQAAISLAKYFKKIIATDASEAQLKNAKLHPQVEYKVALAEESGLPNNSVDLVTVANALHWFNFDKFYTEVNRVLKPNGILATWSYADSWVNDDVDKVMHHLARDILKDYWPAGNKMVVDGYKDVKLPFPELTPPAFNYSIKVDLDRLMGFAYSWSSTQRYINETGNDPVALVKKDLQDAWGNESETKAMTWRLALKLARKPN